MRIRWARLGGAMVGYALIAAFGYWLAPARAQSAEEPQGAAAPADQPRLVEPLRPFEKHPTGPGAIPYSELRDTPPRPLTRAELDSPGIPMDRYREIATDTKESVTGAGAWANQNHSAAVTAAWSRVTEQGVARAQAGNANNESGLNGTSDVGVR